MAIRHRDGFGAGDVPRVRQVLRAALPPSPILRACCCRVGTFVEVPRGTLNRFGGNGHHESMRRRASPGGHWLALLLLAFVLIAACSDGNAGRLQGEEPDGSVEADGSVELDGGAELDANGADAEVEPGQAASLLDSPLCRAGGYPAQECDGDPHGQWRLAALCANRYDGCSGAKVTIEGTATATIRFE